ncbi:FERM, ARHGEF and pleckstrin domain-containing protein 2 [Neophocaena asiaeorientalis asiaeorientalis]|uniref:FERM, ARHGEF and pleckstrin domain-containing protein 2 n=1 Tax=Neophocaena asiaeorientalis asiaeorientalis TaxID=1706337 RepID=A0A341CMD8_NEOAA|nr:FERM, ARHGEF and pleckstrin domain-containing protein 2 [Neophocaena asiaeorientalis asiaeorientalis]
MGELEGTYRVLQTPGTRLGAQTPAGVSTLEPGHGPSAAAAWPAARTPIRVQLLDSSVEVFDVEPKCCGQVLLTQVWKRLNLIECDYFGLEFQNVQSCWIWLEPMKPIVRQVRRPKNTVLRLAVKFFPPDPGQLQEEYTRYLFALQLKRDLLEERLTCTDTTAALLASHLLQAEIGDYEEALVREHLRAHEYLPGQERALERILELHRGHAGQTPAESDFQVLEIARKLEMYGIRFHTASDREGAKINLAVSHMGVLVFQSSTKINTFNWSRLRKLSFKRKRFLIKLHPEVHGPYQDTLEFVLGSRDACKNFWKTCVEYHTFFRLSDQPKPRARAILFSRGSSFRYSGRTQKQLVDYVKDGGMKRIPYERKHSKTQMSLRALNANLPRQSVLFTEGTRTPASPSSTSASFCSGPASPPAPVGLLGSKDSSGSPTGPPAPSARWPAAERSGVAAAPPPGPPAFQPCQGVGSGRGVWSCGPSSTEGLSRAALGLEAGGAGRERAGHSGHGEGALTVGPSPSRGAPTCGRQSLRGGPLFTLTSAQLPAFEFRDGGLADISFFAGGSEAFPFPFGSLRPQALLCGRLGSAPSSPEGSSPEPARGSGVRGFESEEEGSPGDAHPADTSELLEVKAQASLMQRLLSPSAASSLRLHRSETSSLSNAPLPGSLSAHTPSSAAQSEASSMANFPACSVRSEASSAFHFSDIVDQLEQLSCPPTTAEDPSGSDTDSWGSEAEAPLDVSLFFGSPFAPTRGERVLFDLQSNVKNLTPGEQVDENLSCCLTAAPGPSWLWSRDVHTRRPRTSQAMGPSALVLTGRRLWRDCVTVTDVTGASKVPAESSTAGSFGVELRGLGAAPLLRSGCSKPAEDGVLRAAQAPRGGGRAPSGVSRHLAPSVMGAGGLSVESPQLPSTRKTPPSLSPLGPAEQGSSPLLSPVLSDAGGAGTDDQEELRHKCAPADEAYFIAKEILATERTYLKDLEVITVWFRSAVVKADAMPADLMTLLFSNIDPIYEFHRGFLREVEQRLALWEGSSSAQATGDHRRIGDVLLSNMLQLKVARACARLSTQQPAEWTPASPPGQCSPESGAQGQERSPGLRPAGPGSPQSRAPVQLLLLSSRPFPASPAASALRAAARIVSSCHKLVGGGFRPCHPQLTCPGTCTEGPPHAEALKAITEVTSTLQHSLVRLENLQKLMELQRDLVGIENLIAPGREFIREGCLHKLTRKGPQQRMFFLFSDMLLYTGRGASGTSHFRIRGLLPLRGMLLMVLDPPVEERENERSVPHCFTIYAAQKTVVVAASTQLEKEKWMRDLNAAIDAAKSSADTALAPLGSVLCPHPRRPSDEVSLEESEDDARRARCSSGGPGQHRASTAMHVCWDRTTSISRADRSAAVENQLSGYLLRKFKNSSGWQKLWVVFTNFCLFFYKTHRDDCPLASLPLLGYSVSLPGEADGIHKEHVFKLQFKSHVYFFRAESKYTLRRWMEVIESASTSPGRAGTPEEEA